MKSPLGLNPKDIFIAMKCISIRSYKKHPSADTVDGLG